MIMLSVAIIVYLFLLYPAAVGITTSAVGVVTVVITAAPLMPVLLAH